MRSKALRPLALFVAVTLTTVALALLHVFKPSAPKAAIGSTVKVGDVYRGETVYSQNCAVCHGADGGGGVGPQLVGRGIPLVLIKSRIDAGSGVMPPQLVSGRAEEDVIAYVASLTAK
jgi:mono/diheme cytochrome c family protein